MIKEEAEMAKNIEWLKEKVLELQNNGNVEVNQTEAEREIGRLQKWAWNNCVDRVYELINQLDEPEVLSREWINRHTYHEDEYDFYYADPDELKNLLVPKQELPVIPKFVADYLDFAKSDVPLMRVMELANTRNEWPKWKKEYDWISANDETFARAWLDGYTVGEEPLYRARLKVITDEFIASYLRTQSSDAEDRLKALEIGSKYIHEDYRHLSEFTEDELKRLDIWDSEQWEIEEMEV